MNVEVIQQRLLTYKANTVLEQEHALKEIAQEIALLALSRAGFFNVAAFQGGTALRILYGLERFSEDLDFVLLNPNQSFNWSEYINSMQDEFSAYGYALEVVNKTKLDKNIRSAFIKADSQGGIMLLKDARTNRPQLQIKLEVDVNPPEGSDYELKYLDFPLAFSIQTQNLPSLFASKCHALLCRTYIKGRDWYDFSWYVRGKTQINFNLLTHALNQAGPWKNQNHKVTKEWFIKELKNKIKQINWSDAKKDVQRFLQPRELESLNVWSEDFFISRVDKLDDYLKS